MWFDYLFPTRSISKKEFKAWASWSLIIINTLFFLWEIRLIKLGLLPILFQDFGFSSELFLRNMAGFWPTLITHTFLHGNWIHLVGNMYYLWVFGPPLEERTGSLEFLALYFGWGILGALTQTAFNPDSSGPCIGASGAIAGVLGATFVLRPFTKTPMAAANLLYLGFWFLLQMVRGVGSLTDVKGELEPVAYWAHAGGFTAGAVGIYLWLLPHPNEKK